MADERRVTIEFGGSAELTEREIWPDRDAPEDWTAADVVAVLKHAGRREVLREWDIDREITFDVCGPGGVFVVDW